MSIESISGCGFALKPLHQQAYELEVTFHNQASGIVSKKKFFFKETSKPSHAKILDIYSQNGSCPEVVQHLFTQRKGLLFTAKDEKAIAQAAKKWGEEKTNGPSVLVLDLKDQSQSYKDQAAIGECETAFCDFLQNDVIESPLKRAHTVHKIFKEKLPVDFVLCEGSLKCDLLKQFSEAETEYFLKHREGRKKLCQYAEFYMNAFKLGQQTRETETRDYFLASNAEEDAFHPASQSTVWYPAEYEELYSLESPFFEVMKPIFSLSGSTDAASRISSITVERLP